MEIRKQRQSGIRPREVHLHYGRDTHCFSWKLSKAVFIVFLLGFVRYRIVSCSAMQKWISNFLKLASRLGLYACLQMMEIVGIYIPFNGCRLLLARLKFKVEDRLLVRVFFRVRRNLGASSGKITPFFQVAEMNNVVSKSSACLYGP